MTFITWACLRCVQELATILGPQNPTQRSCDGHWSCFMVRHAPDLLLILGGSMSLSSAEQLPATRHAHTPGVPA